MANLDMEPLNIMGDWYQVERKPSLKPPVVEILIFTEKNTDISNQRRPWRNHNDEEEDDPAYNDSDNDNMIKMFMTMIDAERSWSQY